MDELILRELEGVATAAELAELRRWRDASPDHERRYREVSAVWALTGTRQEIEWRTPVPSTRALWRPTAVGTRRRSGRRRLLSAAATAAAVLVAVIGVLRYAGTWRPEEVADSASFQTGADELTTAVLPDGTVARLGPNTVLRLVGSDGRDVQLDGRAFFAVAHDPERPFRVRTDAGRARVLGTRFEMNTRRDRLRLLVVEGVVALAARGDVVELRAGDVGEAAADRPLSVTRVDSPEALLDWMGTWVAFEATPLANAAAELSIRLGLHIEIRDSTVANRTITGWFDAEDRQILTMVCRVVDVQCNERDGRILIEP